MSPPKREFPVCAGAAGVENSEGFGWLLFKFPNNDMLVVLLSVLTSAWSEKRCCKQNRVGTATIIGLATFRESGSSVYYFRPSDGRAAWMCNSKCLPQEPVVTYALSKAKYLAR